MTFTTDTPDTTTTTRPTRWDAAADHLESLRTLRPAGVPADIPEHDYAVPLGTFLTRWATGRPDATAIHFYGRDITWRELDAQVGAVAGWLRSRGVGPGDRVAVFLANCPQFIVTMLATLRLGGVHVPVNPMFRAADLTHELTDAAPRVLVAQSDLVPLVTQVTAAHPDNPVLAGLTVASTALGDELTGPPVPAAPFAWPADDGGTDWSEMLTATPVAADEVTVDPHALAALNYTGGTTGLPKGCEHTQAHMVYTALSIHLGRGSVPGTDATPAVAVAFQPVFWIAGRTPSSPPSSTARHSSCSPGGTPPPSSTSSNHSAPPTWSAWRTRSRRSSICRTSPTWTSPASPNARRSPSSGNSTTTCAPTGPP